jgi:hypothetical protein
MTDNSTIIALVGDEDINLHFKGYGEPGYDDPESGLIATANWNHIDDEIQEKLESANVGIEWSDEWEACCECSKLIRTTGDSYSWSLYGYNDDEGQLTCGHCVNADPDDYLASIEGKVDRCVTIFDFDPTEHGYKRLEGDFERGLHSGQDADPRVIAESLRSMNIERFIFVLDVCGQFSTNFGVCIREEDYERIDPKQWENAAHNGPSVSDAAKSALRNAGTQMDKLDDSDGPKVAVCDEGGATVYQPSREEFVAGKAMDYEYQNAISRIMEAEVEDSAEATRIWDSGIREIVLKNVGTNRRSKVDQARLYAVSVAQLQEPLDQQAQDRRQAEVVTSIEQFYRHDLPKML